MTSYIKLKKRAKLMGHELTPELKAELKMLVGVSDSKIMSVKDKIVISEMADKFQVPFAAMEKRLNKGMKS